MKRTLNVDPSSSSSFNSATETRDQNPQQQADAHPQRAPAMQAPAANDPPPGNPLFGFDIDAPLPDWEEFAQMLPHTPPAENRRDASDENASLDSDDERSPEEFSSEESSDSCFDNNIATKISEGLAQGHDRITIRESSVRGLREILEVCKRHTKITLIEIDLSGSLRGIKAEMQEVLTDFFKTQHTIKSVCLISALTSEVRLSAQLLISLLQNTEIKQLSIQNFQPTSLSAAESKLLIEICKNNSNLRYLELANISDGEKLAKLIGVFAENSALEKLYLRRSTTKSIAEPLAAHIRSNRQLKVLRICPRSSSDMQDLIPVFEALKETDVLEVLELGDRLIPVEPSDLSPAKLLAGHRRLKVLRLPMMIDMTKEAVENFSELIKTLPALTSVGLSHMPWRQTDRLVLADGLASIPHLENLEASLDEFSCGEYSSESDRQRLLMDFLNGLGKCKNLKTIRFHSLPSLDPLLEFLGNHPHISSIELPNWCAHLGETQEKLMTRVKNSSHITDMFFVDESDYTGQTARFVQKLREALVINRQIWSNLGRASEAMKALLDEKSGKDENLSYLPLDVTNELTMAIARHVPAEKAKAIFDELILHAPPHQ